MRYSFPVDERMSSLSNVVKFSDVVEDMSYSLDYSARGSKPAAEKADNNRVQDAERILRAAKYEALKIVADAREQALFIKTSARDEAAKALEESKKEGYEQGLSDGLQDARNQTMQMLEEAGRLLSELHERKNDLIRKSHGAIKELSIAIAKKVIDAEIQENDETFLKLFRQAVQDYTSGDWVKLTVSSCEYDFVTSNTELLLSMVKGAKYIDVVELSNRPKGTCVVETSSGIMDSSVETQLERIGQAFEKSADPYLSDIDEETV